ncbi:hypothetical protein WT41_11690 [Burkholderia territorii]|nr:hypothetical protein WT38_23435 [Burkholderia territorii]KWA45183.1 hypothetical protein WT41_11690 [Burkholderia territorii]
MRTTARARNPGADRGTRDARKRYAGRRPAPVPTQRKTIMSPTNTTNPVPDEAPADMPDQPDIPPPQRNDDLPDLPDPTEVGEDG